MTPPNRPDDEPLKRAKRAKRAIKPPNHMEAPPPEPTKPPTTRRKGLGDTTLLHLRLTTPQADWLRSTASREGISIASVVRGMIDAERVEDEDPAVVEAAFQRFMVWIATEPEPSGEVVRGYYGGCHAMAQPGHEVDSDTARTAHMLRGVWVLYDADGPAPCRWAGEAQAIAWCLKGVLP